MWSLWVYVGRFEGALFVLYDINGVIVLKLNNWNASIVYIVRVGFS